MPFFVSGLYKIIGKLADRIFFGVQGPLGVGFGVSFFVSGLYKFMGKLADRIFFGVQGPPGVGFGVPFFVSGLCKFMGKLAWCPGPHGGWVWGAVLCVWPL